MSNTLYIGLDVGSTTIKVVVFDTHFNIIHTSYERHYSDTKNTVCKCLEELVEKYPNDTYKIALTGSGAMFVAKILDLHFIQEVVACKRAVEKYVPQTDVVIELGGEDAKIIYFDQSIEQRMNGTCAGGTGAFLDQMALLLDTDTIGLNNLAQHYTTIYPIASRCGVFAKSDIQPLLNEGAEKENIAVSVLQAVVNQTISGLACGRPIRGNVAFLGGPLSYLPELRKRFIETLKLTDEQVIIPEDAHLFVAKGAGIDAVNYHEISPEKLKAKIQTLKHSHDSISEPLKPLFTIEKEYQDFKTRHDQHKIARGNLKNYKGDCFLGIDAGSTTTKLVLIANNGKLLYDAYGSNEGKPLQSVIKMLLDLYKILPKKAVIRYSGVTGYGEKLIQTGINAELNEIETIAHYTAAKQFMPEVTSIVDIGGQDMKYISIKDGAINNIMLNEACSSGCGSFIETFAKSLNLSIHEFVEEALQARKPVDLGSRCTVFMNSKIKQAQKEGYSVGDISAGLSYSVIKNAIQKVMKVRDVETLGDHIIVQGGTFYNDAVLRAFELIVGKEVIRPDIAGLMGAYGVAFLAKEKYETLHDKTYFSKILTAIELENLKINVSHIRCNGCENHCLLTINEFSNKKRFISGNRCERGAGKDLSHNDLPNLYRYKYERTFHYTPLPEEKAIRGTIGIPRVLNMYEDYPFWFTFLTHLGFRVIVSEKSNRKTYEKGMESMPSESVCYPAKLTHGHIMSLIQAGIKTIFYPCVPYSRKENQNADNHYNCPIVIAYPEVIQNNVEEIKSIKFLNPYLPFEPSQLAKTILELPEFEQYHFTKKEILKAAKEAEKEYEQYKNDILQKGKEAIQYLKVHDLQGIVLAGRPYHVDPEINHGIDTMITSLGLPVLTEDSVARLVTPKCPLRVVDQWTYHTRLYAAADYVGKNEHLELVQLNSFGCGVDAVTTDQVEEILKSYGKMYTLIKIDEVNNLGAVRIRIRSLLASMNRRKTCDIPVSEDSGNYEVHKVIFDKGMKNDYTILIPQMAPIQFELLQEVMNQYGYHVKLLRECTPHTVEVGLKYVNNDACYPAILTTGQMIEALQSGEYDLNKTAIIISQTGGGCRATNYIAFIRKALNDAGLSHIPVISFNFSGLEKMPGFKITLPMFDKMLKAIVYGDLLQKLLLKNRAYEIHKGDSQARYDHWMEKCKAIIRNGTTKQYRQSIYEIVEDFEKIEVNLHQEKPRVGIVGEILIKYHPFGNNNIIQKLEEDGAEVLMPDLMGFIKYDCTQTISFNQLMHLGEKYEYLYRFALKVINVFEKDVKKAYAKSKKGYLIPIDIWELSKKVDRVLSLGNQAGEGWFLTAEMIEYIEHDVPNVVCVQPFACLPNHIIGKGMIKKIREIYPSANIIAVDYDPGSSEANQTNRLKLMMTVAKDNQKSTVITQETSQATKVLVKQ